MRDQVQCSVLRCSAAVDRTWSTGEVEAEWVEWGVCLQHFRRMRLGLNWATHTDLTHLNERWILTGADLDVVRTTETLQDWRVSLEFSPNSRDIRVALTTHHDKLGVLLTEDQAHRLGRVLLDLSPHLGPLEREN